MIQEGIRCKKKKKKKKKTFVHAVTGILKVIWAFPYCSEPAYCSMPRTGSCSCEPRLKNGEKAHIHICFYGVRYSSFCIFLNCIFCYLFLVYIKRVFSLVLYNYCFFSFSSSSVWFFIYSLFPLFLSFILQP